MRISQNVTFLLLGFLGARIVFGVLSEEDHHQISLDVPGDVMNEVIPLINDNAVNGGFPGGPMDEEVALQINDAAENDGLMSCMGRFVGFLYLCNAAMLITLAIATFIVLLA